MPGKSNKLTVAISSRSLFDLSDSHKIFVEHGVDAYRQHQIENEDNILSPGPAFGLVSKLLKIKDADNNFLVDVVLVSRNSAQTGLRVFNSIEHHGLRIERAAFTGGSSPYKYALSFDTGLYLSMDHDDVRGALSSGIAAAALMPSINSNNDNDIRIAFDGDAVLFSDESERVYKEGGLKAFTEYEMSNQEKPLNGGPFKSFLEAIHRIQSLSDGTQNIRTALVTARGSPCHKRVIHTLNSWNIRIDEAFFMAGTNKSPVLREFGADIFFDDQHSHCESANEYVAAGHVLNGVANEAANDKQVEKPRKLNL